MSNSTHTYPELLSLAVHEFRTPASVVGGYLRMLERDTDSPLSERQRRMVEEAQRSCARLVDFVNELSDIGKLDAGALSLAQQPLDLFTLVQEVATGVHEAEDRGVTFNVQGSAVGARTIGDATRLRRAFDAIFRAILREAPSDAAIVAERRLVTENGRNSAVVVVSEASSVHSTYDASRGPFDEKRGGLGLALPLARRVIERHRGHIWSPRSSEAEAETTLRGAAIVNLPLEGAMESNP
jgi:signal transduction histidine kinase